MSSSRTLRTLAAAAITALSLGSLVGCSTAATGSSSSSGSGSGDFAGQELTVLLISSHQGAADWLASEFKKETGATIKPVIVPYDEIGAKFTLDQQSGANTVDVAAPWYVTIGDLAKNGVIQDLTEWIDDNPDIDTDDFIPSINDPYTLADDKRYGLPFDGDTHVLFYNKEILERNGFTEPPATWDEYVTQAKTVTENEKANGVYGAAIFGQKSPLILGSTFANRLAGFGGEFLDEKGKPRINSPEAVAAAQSLLDVAPYALPTPAETAFGEGNAAWFSGKVAFIENWTDLGVGSENPETGSTVAGKWGVTALPVGGDNTTPRAPLNAGFTWTIAANTSKTELAKAFIKFAASSDVNEKLLTANPPTGIDPNRQSSLDSATYGDLFPDLQRVNRTSLGGALAWPTGPNATTLAQVLTDELAKLLAGQGGTAKEALDRVQKKWEEILER